MTIWRMLVAGLAVWRLSRLLFKDRGYNGRSQSLAERQESFFGTSIPGWILDCVCWLSIWLSAQTAIWVAGGLAGVFLNWIALTSLSRLLTSSAETANESSLSLDPPVQLRTETRNGDFSCFTGERTMQANHG